jgi:AcrR family transcriptional regulator
VTVAPREELPTLRGRQTQAAINAAARIGIARKGILPTTIADIAAEAGRSTASSYDYYDSKDAVVREWALRFRDEARERATAAAEPDLDNRQRADRAVPAHWHSYRHRLAEMIGVSQLAWVNDDSSQYWSDICELPIAPATATVNKAQQARFSTVDDACIGALANVLSRTVHHGETSQP